MTLFVVIIIIINFFFTSESCRYNQQSKLVIDQDGGADDAMSVFIALLREQHFKGPELLAITTSHGNVNESQCYINTQKMLDVADRRDVPIYRGSQNALMRNYPEDNFFGLDGLGDNKLTEYRPIEAQPPPAAFILIELSKKHRDELVVVALGPLTNIALAIRIDPGFINRLQHLYVAAGTINDSSDPHPEYNALHDVEAYHIVTQHAHPDKVTVFPFSRVRETINTSANWRRNILGAINTRIMKAQNDFESISFPKNTKWHLLDPVVMSAALNNKIMESIKLSNNGIVLCGENRGFNINNFKADKHNVNLVYSIDDTVYEKFLYETFSGQRR